MKIMILLLCVTLLFLMCGCKPDDSASDAVYESMDSNSEIALTTNSSEDVLCDSPNDVFNDVPEDSFIASPDDEPREYEMDILDDYWTDMLHDFWIYARQMAGAVSSFGRASILIDRIYTVPQNVNEHIVSDSYAIGSCTELTYTAFREENHERPLICEIRYPRVYVPVDIADSTSSNPISWDLMEEINALLYETAKSMMSEGKGDLYGEAYSNYDIVYASEDMISICYFGVITPAPRPFYCFSATTIDMRTGKVMYLEDFIDTNALTVENIISDYTVLHKNSSVSEVDEIHQSMFEQTVKNFLLNIGSGHNYFISDENGICIYLVFRDGQYYYIYGQ